MPVSEAPILVVRLAVLIQMRITVIRAKRLRRKLGVITLGRAGVLHVLQLRMRSSDGSRDVLSGGGGRGVMVVVRRVRSI